MTLKRAVAAAFLACVITMGLFVVMEKGGAFFKVTGLELSQVNMTVKATWDETDSQKYIVSVYDGERKIEEGTVKKTQFVTTDLQPQRDYEIQVISIDKEGNESRKDSETIHTKPQQKITVASDQEGSFTDRTFRLKAKAPGKIRFISADKSVAVVNQKGKVDIKGKGMTDITIIAGETEDKCLTTTTVKVNAGEKYEGEMPELPNAIASEAKKCAWPYGTSKSTYKYGGGSPTGYFKETISRVYPDHNHWKIKQTRWGASCDVFVGTVVRATGYDMNFPKGLNKDYSYLPKSSKFKKVSLSDLQPGDIIMYSFKKGGGHICIYIEDDNGVGYIANAHYKLKTYGIIEKKNPHFNPGKYKSFGVYRTVEPCTTPISEGEKGESVEKTQAFLKWAGYFDEEIDGNYGSSTTEAVKKYQKSAGLEADGKFNQETIDKTNEYTRNTIMIEPDKKGERE